MVNKKQIIVFDLDGTLVNSAPDLCYALNKTLKEIETFFKKMQLSCFSDYNLKSHRN